MERDEAPDKRAMVRNTTQRRAIRKAFADAGRPLSPQEVLGLAQKDVPKLGIATVYRTIKGLVDEKRLTAVELPGEPSRYEIAGKEHHHHFHCRDCDRVYEVEGCPGDLRDLVPAGFELQDHDVVLYGLCLRCRNGQ